MAKDVEDIINGANYLLEAQKTKLIEELSRHDLLRYRLTENRIYDFLYSILGLMESDFEPEDRVRIKQFLSDLPKEG